MTTQPLPSFRAPTTLPSTSQRILQGTVIMGLKMGLYAGFGALAYGFGKLVGTTATQTTQSCLGQAAHFSLIPIVNQAAQAIFSYQLPPPHDPNFKQIKAAIEVRDTSTRMCAPMLTALCYNFVGPYLGFKTPLDINQAALVGWNFVYTSAVNLAIQTLSTALGEGIDSNQSLPPGAVQINQQQMLLLLQQMQKEAQAIQAAEAAAARRGEAGTTKPAEAAKGVMDAKPQEPLKRVA